jgi:hypothetical protein
MIDPQCFRRRLRRACFLALAALGAQAARADFELTAPDGRRVLLKDDGSWQYVDDKAKANPEAPPKQEGEAVLSLSRKIDRGTVCSVVLTLQNDLPYEIVNIVPYLSAFRPNGVVFQTVSIAFQSIRPSGVQESSADFSGISCSAIGRIQVNGGDRCEMGDLNKFSDVKGQCLARVKVVPSELLRFDK